MSLWQRSAVLRKGASLAARFPRMYARYVAVNPVNPMPMILANSFPKSGTHLLKQILAAFPGSRDYGTFLASQPSVTLRDRTDASACAILNGTPPGELVLAHLFHKAHFEALLDARGFASYFIYRDLRDVVCSEAHYITHMNRWHRMHGHFRRLSSEEARVELSVCGLSGEEASCEYGHIARRFDRYAGWLRHPGTLAVRFEDLIRSPSPVIIEGIVRHFLSVCDGMDAPDHTALLVQRALAAVVPRESHTYREGGGTGNWRRVFTARHKRLFKERAGDLLVTLGYERDLDW